VQAAPAQAVTPDLLQRAQILAQQEAAASSTGDVADLSPQALREALQNLRLHQFELEMQNDELRRTQAALDTAKARYFDFYDLAPVGYVTVSDQALILQTNLTAAKLLGLPRAELVGKALPGFLLAPDADSFYLLCKKALTSGNAQSTELRMRRPDSQPFWAQLHAIAATGDDGAAVIRLVLSDITARKQLEERLISSEADTKALLDGASDAIFINDPQGRFQYVNQRAVQLLGYSRGELLGMCVTDITPAEDFQLTRRMLAQLMLTGSLRYEPSLLCRDGSTVPAELTGALLSNGNGFAACRDITERRQFERAAKEASEYKFRLVADNTSDGIVIFGADRHIKYVSPAYVKQLGYSEAEERNRSPEQIYALIHPEERDALFARLARALSSKEDDLRYSYRIQHQLGHYIWREDSARFQYDESGSFSGACVVTRDITLRRQAEVDLRIAAAAFETQEAMMITDANSVILRVNRAFTQVTGYTAEEAVGRTPRLLQSGHHDKDFYRQLWETVRSTGNWQGEVWDRHKDGQVYPKWLAISSVTGIDGVVSHYIGSHFDLSERKRAEAAMQEMNRNLKRSRQQLRRLVALNETTLEKEKRHIAREVHDELGQVLTALRMDLSLAIIRHASEVPDLLDALKRMKIQVDRAILGVRNVATSLRPAALDLGLVPAIEWLCH